MPPTQATEWYDEISVGRAINSSNISRREFFVTTKVHPRNLGFEATRKAVRGSLAVFGSFVDLVLLHYPHCFSGVCTPEETLKADKAGGWQESWRALTELVSNGEIGAAGVSNFGVEELGLMNPLPDVVQNWFDPFHQDRATLSWCRDHGVAYTSYSTLGGQWEHQALDGGGLKPNPVFERFPTFSYIH